MKRLYKFSYKKFLSAVLILTLSNATIAQIKENKVDYKVGSGLDFSFNDGEYSFNLGGFIQPGFNALKMDGLERENEFNSRRSYMQFSGNAVKEKVSFLFQLDYSLQDPLLDAWIAYHPIEAITITVGQKQTFLNNREMMYREDRLQFANRSFLSNNFSETGRELGVFVSSKFGDTFGIAPMVALTSGDGRNSFGANSRDSDLGGVKYGGRLDVYPLGFFKPGNDLTSTDLLHEEKLKFVVGAAGSVNIGASNSVGEGHGDYVLYDKDGDNMYADYTQMYADILFKYQGFSLLAEYVDASASNIGESYVDANAVQILAPTQISNFLTLGESFNVQAGYVTLSGFSFDARYESATQEFVSNANSVFQSSDAYTIGLSKYFVGNSLKVQTSYTNFNPNVGLERNQIDVLFQITF